MQTLPDQFVTSTDGTRLSYRTLGEGPTIVVVHGALCSSDLCLDTARLLSDRWRVVLLDRRAYLAREQGAQPATWSQDGADIVALLQVLDTPCLLFGHSAGALSSLQAGARRPPQLRRLSLYEPPIELVGEAARPTMEEVRRLHQAGDDLRAVATFLTYTGLPAGTVEDTLAGFDGDAGMLRFVLANAAGVVRDGEAAARASDRASTWAGLDVPCQLLVGGKEGQDPRLVRSVEALAAVLPEARVRRLPEQEHLAQIEAPHLLAEAIADFASPGF
ncbi:MAG: alpha/beta fold hydrolase [Candidatus Dormibacteraceae bacterium]